MSGDDRDDFLSELMSDGVISEEHATALNHKVGLAECDRARIGALSVILKHLHPDVCDSQIEIEATALHLAQLAATALGSERVMSFESYATLVAHVVRNATLIAEEEGGRAMRDSFLSICTLLVDRLCNEGVRRELVSVN